MNDETSRASTNAPVEQPGLTAEFDADAPVFDRDAALALLSLLRSAPDLSPNEGATEA